MSSPLYGTDAMNDKSFHIEDNEIDDKTFYFEAIECLCCSLRVEIAVAKFYDYISRFLPLYSFSLLSAAPEQHHPSVPEQEHPGQVIRVARATAAGVECPMHKVTLSPETRALADTLGLNRPGGFTDRLIMDESDPCLRYVRSLSPVYAPPLYFLRLLKEDIVLGSAHFVGTEPFTEQHIHRMRGLQGPLCIAMGNILQHRVLEEIRVNILDDNQRLRRQLEGLNTVDIIGAGQGLQKTMHKVRQAAAVDVPVLISGETGTGKELIAKALHECSARRNQPFVAVNCGALPPSLIDSELFGFTRGSFTGANAHHKGYFERASGGTLFLDEIGELPLEAQARLLRVLESHEIEKIGGSAPLKLDIRLLAATNRDLPAMVEAGNFRNDLYFRLRVVSIELPPLRQRRQDIPALVNFLLQRSAARFGVPMPTLAEGELDALRRHTWPGNIRELQNVLEEALVCAEGKPLRLRLHTGGSSPASSGPEHGAPASEGRLPEGQLADIAPQGFPTHDEILRDYFSRLLESTKGRISGPQGAAQKAGLLPGTFRFKCAKLGII